ncbi:lactonase family protein [Cryptosporangium minutisporangium]|uniref:Lactonase family protein n=1 Tax=Cryptosporangium minutisporangium TaxID=113569 RepID=A0ABP6T555_9ACTN
MNTLAVGSYTSDMNGSGDGLTVLPGGHLAVASPSYVIADAGTLYAVHEGEGTVASYTLADGGALRPLSTQPTGGASPCHLARVGAHTTVPAGRHPEGRLPVPGGHLVVANYSSGSVSVHPVSLGRIGPRTDLVQHVGAGPDPDRQEGPHPHQILVGADGTITVVDLGLDRLIHYRLDDGALTRTGETVLPPGSGPRHAVVHPSRRWYVAAELAAAVLTLENDVVVATTPATTSDEPTLPSGIVLSPDGRYLYLANRGADTVATFHLDDAGIPALVSEVPSGGVWPRDLALTGDGLVVANERSHTLVFLDLADGVPVPGGRTVEVASPTCVRPVA